MNSNMTKNNKCADSRSVSTLVFCISPRAGRYAVVKMSINY
ncbi:hypothetical protein CUS_5440 [Ruminococcus albus 8]|uniref:Uncharacterized protein n=1 Tax=Ruminococcus albus 8 TaxID=246199 RepID=E9SE21_RUMAL|nr:hypothetical protein CUS_5440 [Ruminococcus albus 8]